MYDDPHSLCFSSIREKITFNENALLRDQRKKWVLLENQHYILNIEDIFTKFTGHPMNWTNMMSSKGQVYAIKIVDFISKTEGPLYFEQVGICNFIFQYNSQSDCTMTCLCFKRYCFALIIFSSENR